MKKIVLAAVISLGLLSAAKADEMTRVKSFCNVHIDDITRAIEELAWENKILDVSLDSYTAGHSLRFNAIVLYEAK